MNIGFLELVMAQAGQHCWTSDGSTLKPCTFDRLGDLPSTAFVIDEDGRKRLVSIYSVHLSRLGAIEACQQHADYWERKAKELESEITPMQSVVQVLPQIAPPMTTVCQKCGAELDDLQDCCPGCLDSKPS